MIRPTLALLALASLAGCSAGPLNNEPGIGNAGRPFGDSIYTPATLAEDIPPPPPEGLEATPDQLNAPVYTVGGPVAAKDAPPAFASLDRSGWIVTPLEVPSDFPAHQPRMTISYLVKNDPRAAGRYPDERTALNVGSEQHNREQFVESVVAPFVAASDVVLFFPRAIAEMRPRQPTRTGGEGYARSPSRVTIMNPPAEPVGEPMPATAPPPQAATPPAQAPAKPSQPAKPAPAVPAQPPAEELKPGGGMPASDVPRR